MTRYDGSSVYSYNMMLGVFQNAANAACAADPARCLAVGAEGNSIPLAAGQGGGTQTANFAGPGGTSWLLLRRSASGRVTPAKHRPPITQPRTPRIIRKGSRGADQQLPDRAAYRTSIWPGPGREVADEVRLDGRRHHGRSRVLHVNRRLGHHGQPELRSDSVDLGAVPTAGHRLRRHRVPGYHGRPQHRARERHDGVPSVGHGTQRPDQLARRLLLARRETRNRVVRWGMYEWAIPATPPSSTAFPCPAHQRRGCRVRASNRYFARSERPDQPGSVNRPAPPACRPAEPC